MNCLRRHAQTYAIAGRHPAAATDTGAGANAGDIQLHVDFGARRVDDVDRPLIGPCGSTITCSGRRAAATLAPIADVATKATADAFLRVTPDPQISLARFRREIWRFPSGAIYHNALRSHAPVNALVDTLRELSREQRPHAHRCARERGAPELQPSCARAVAPQGRHG